MDQLLVQIAARPWLRWPLWVAYAVLFYNAGLETTTWLVEPAAFTGGWHWLWVAAFPLLLAGFFKFNRHLGCAGGRCATGRSPHTDYKAPPGH
jgi:hypothetical protein